MTTPQHGPAQETMAELLASRPGAASLLVSHGMHCIGCAIARFETVAEACAIYGVSAEQLLLEIDHQAEAFAECQRSTT